MCLVYLSDCLFLTKGVALVGIFLKEFFLCTPGSFLTLIFLFVLSLRVLFLGVVRFCLVLPRDVLIIHSGVPFFARHATISQL